MLEFIQLLEQRYQSVLARLDKKTPQYFEYLQHNEQLLYAEAFIRKGQLLADRPDFPVQIAVIGPTQVGKSSVVNLLLNSDVAGVSPLAGYTVHPQGFCHRLDSDDCDGLQHYFGRFQALEQTALNRHRFDCYAISTNPTDLALLPRCLLWDTPDFDPSMPTTAEGVIRTIAWAMSWCWSSAREKYADQSVWEVMKIIEPFDNRP